MKRRIVIAVAVSILLNIIIVNVYFSATSDVNPIDQLLKRNRLTVGEREWLEEKGVLVYGSDQNSPPLRYVDERSGQYIGLVVDYVNALSIELGVEIKLEPQVWSRALENLAEGKTDFSDMFPSKERAEKYLFTNPIYNLRGIIVVSSHNAELSTLNDLKDKVIALPEGDFAVDFIKSKNENQRILFTRDNYEALEMVKNGLADAVVGDEPVLSYFLKGLEDSEELKILPRPAYEMDCVLALPKTEKTLLGILNKGISRLKTKDMMLKIQQKWLGVSASFVQAEKAERILVLLLIFFTLMLLVLYVFSQWNRTLKLEVARRTEELNLSRNELQITFDGLSHYLAIYNSDCSITNVNRSFSEFSGKSKEEILGENCSSLENQFFTSCDGCIIRKTVDTGNEHHQEVEHKGHIFQLSTYPIELNREAVQKVLLMVRDVTTEKISEKKYLQTNKMAAIGQLAAGMAHEIRNPLGLIRNYSYLLRHSSGKDEVQAMKSINLIESSVEKASNIIDNLLNFSRLDNAQEETVMLQEFITDILKLEEKLMQKHRISNIVICDENESYCINREILKHIVINLVGNAIDAMPRGGLLRIEVYKNESSLVLSCSDTGTGIEQKNIDNIFHPFFTTKQRGNGTGLGLYIVWSDVKRCGGDIKVESSPGEGTLFTVYLPLYREVKHESV